jgi:hypothetical protein
VLMRNTPQIIGVCALVTFVILTMPPQQMFALPDTSSRKQSNSPNDNAKWKSIIISEIMADPSPSRGLPEVEYVELFNRTSNAISLTGWHFSDATSSITLPETILGPREYVIISPKVIDPAVSNAFVVANLPSLNNSGDSLRLTDSNGSPIDIVNYSDDWYRDSRRSEGGWSLELIDPENTCEEAGNWAVTDDPRGGTPGEQNSIIALNPDVTGPDLISVHVLDTVTLQLVFNEKLAADALSYGQFIVTPSLDIRTLSFSDSSRTAIILHLGNPISGGVLYSVSLRAVFDCAGNLVQEAKRRLFALPQRASQGDIVINEVLFNPPPDGVDFVELYNASHKYIDLNGWAIGSQDDDANVQKASLRNNVVLPPSCYVTFSADIVKLSAQYVTPDSSLVALRIPSYADDHGTVILFSALDSVMDRFDYSADMHNVFVRSGEGVSLERISATVATNDRANWTSASSTAGFGTPGLRNSAALDVPSPDARPVRVTPSVFTPLAGQPNAAEISYHFNQPGNVATINISDNRGVIIRRLANNVLLGTEGTLRWEGDRDDGNRAQTGYYMIVFQVFASDGSSQLYREAVAVSPKY